jgi:hypothetical protein
MNTGLTFGILTLVQNLSTFEFHFFHRSMRLSVDIILIENDENFYTYIDIQSLWKKSKGI